MIKQTITYENFDGETVTEDHYFHLSKSEIIDMELAGEKEDRALSTRLTLIGKSGDGAAIIKMFKDIISAAYGQRVDGSGSQFFKSEEVSKAFLSSLAFDAFLGTLTTDAEAAVKFVSGILPKDLMANAEVQTALAEVPMRGPETGKAL